MYYIFVICDNRLISSRVKIKVHKKQCENEYYEDNKPHKLSRIDKKKVEKIHDQSLDIREGGLRFLSK